MPSGRTHDLATALAALPAASITYALSGKADATIVLAAAFLFGGMMFGPDLDTSSKQYSRWSIFRFIWWPYGKALGHRSRWTHGLLVSTALRVIYFMGVVTLVSYCSVLAVSAYNDASAPGLLSLARGWHVLGEFTRTYFGMRMVWYAIAGVWLGAAVHMVCDLIFTYIKTGRVMRVI